MGCLSLTHAIPDLPTGLTLFWWTRHTSGEVRLKSLSTIENGCIRGGGSPFTHLWIREKRKIDRRCPRSRRRRRIIACSPVDHCLGLAELTLSDGGTELPRKNFLPDASCPLRSLAADSARECKLRSETYFGSYSKPKNKGGEKVITSRVVIVDAVACEGETQASSCVPHSALLKTKRGCKLRRPPEFPWLRFFSGWIWKVLPVSAEFA